MFDFLKDDDDYSGFPAKAPEVAPEKPKELDLEQMQAAQGKKNAFMNAIAAIADNHSSENSYGNFWLGKMNGESTSARDLAAKLQADSDPLAKQTKAYEYMKKKREMSQMGDETKRSDALKLTDSNETKALKALAGRWGIKVTPEMTGADIYQLIDPKKMMETEAQSAVNFENQKKLKQMEISGELAKVNAQKNTEKGKFDNLPEDKKLTITELSKKNAAKNAIKNQINAVLKNWDSLSEDQQVAQGRTLLKTLNSAEGADAIGSEEAKRLGGKLEFAMGNLSPFNSNPIQFGRDLKGFKEQAQHSAKALENAVGANQSLIDESYGRQAPAPDGLKVGEVRKGHEYIGGDPSKPESWKKLNTQTAGK